MLIFSLFGAVFGRSEETIAFTIIFVPMAISMGYDSIVGVALCFDEVEWVLGEKKKLEVRNRKEKRS